MKFPIIGKSKVDKPFMDIYNCGTYELIPYTPIKFKGINLKIGNKYVQLRFLMINLWLLRLIKHLKGLTNKDFLNRQKNIFALIKSAKNLSAQGTNYIGINYDEKIAQKIKISESQIIGATYYPELSAKSSKGYKLIATS